MPFLQIYSKTEQWRTQVRDRVGGELLDVAATSGFGHIPECVGVPVGVPADLTSGIPVVIDSTGPTLYAYIGGWVAL